jgi:hypothetical protein
MSIPMLASHSMTTNKVPTPEEEARMVNELRAKIQSAMENRQSLGALSEALNQWGNQVPMHLLQAAQRILLRVLDEYTVAPRAFADQAQIQAASQIRSVHPPYGAASHQGTVTQTAQPVFYHLMTGQPSASAAGTVVGLPLSAIQQQLAAPPQFSFQQSAATRAPSQQTMAAPQFTAPRLSTAPLTFKK